jgi:hypothetical protein
MTLVSYITSSTEVLYDSARSLVPVARFVLFRGISL